MVLLLLLLPAGPLDGLVRVLATSDDPAAQRDILVGMGEALAGRRSVKSPEGWAAVYRKLSASKDGEVRRRVAQMSLLFGSAEALADLKKQAQDGKINAEDRQFALQTLLDHGDADTFSLVRSLLDDLVLSRAALRGLARFDDKETPSLVLTRYAKLSADAREDAVGTLTSRPAYALALLDAIESKAVPRADVSAYWARQMVALKNPAVSKRLEAVWGTIRPAAKDRDALMKKYKTLPVKEGDRVKGRGLFAKTCANCHKMFGEGGAIGPELTGSQRRNPEYILTKVLDPNASVPREHQVTLIRTTRGRVITGVIKNDDGRVLLVQTPTEEVRVRVGDVEKREPQKTSLMPENQLKDWPDADVRDLLAYLGGEDQVGVAAEMTRLEPIGDQGVMARLDDENLAVRWAAAVRRAAPPWLLDVVQAYTAVAVYHDLDAVTLDDVMAWLADVTPGEGGTTGTLHEIPVCYEMGPDLEMIAEHTRLSVEDVIRLHTSVEYTVYAIGFCPGFPYLGYLPPQLCGIPRRSSPRLRVEPGTVGLTGRQTGIYTEPRPGGWALIGRTPLTLVDVAHGYFPLRTGDRVRFTRIDAEAFKEEESKPRINTDQHGSKAEEI